MMNLRVLKHFLGVMMKKIFLTVVLVSMFLAWTTNVLAASYNMIFWYPGEAGSTSEAAPVLTAFFDYVNKNLKGDSITGKYFNSVSSGESFLRSSSPKFGIVSWITLQDNRSKIPAHNILVQTLPLPYGSSEDQFSVVGNASLTNWNGGDNLTIYSSVPVSLEFLKTRFALDIKGNATVKPISGILGTLKKMAATTGANEIALLTPMEKYTLDNMKSDWTKNIKELQKCKLIPSAQLIYFGDRPLVTDAFLKILREMPNNPEGKEILETLRLKGFQ